MYCGDETGSFVGEVGSHTSRFGYGGDDAPKYVVPSCCLPHNHHATGAASRTKQRIRLQVASSCYRLRGGGGASAPTTTTDDAQVARDDRDHTHAASGDYRIPLRGPQVPTPSVGEEEVAAGPIVDPNHFLSQGESIDDWDAYASLWESAMDVLCVRDASKHGSSNRGGSPQEQQQQEHASGLSSTNLSTTDGSPRTNDGALVHPVLVIRPGFTHWYGQQTGGSDTSPMQLDSVEPTKEESLLVEKSHHQQHHQHRAEMERLVEHFMEDVGAGAMFMAPAPMLAAFSHGRQTALVVDVGASGCRVTPVVDGLLLRQAQRRSGRGGDWMGNVAWKALNDALNHQAQQPTNQPVTSPIKLRPRYQVGASAPGIGDTTTAPRGVFHRWAMQDLMYELRTSPFAYLQPWCYDPSVPFLHGHDGVVANSPVLLPLVGSGSSDAGAGSSNGNTYELPDGTRIDMTTPTGKDLCRVTELLFTDELPFLPKPEDRSGRLPATMSDMSIPRLIHASLSAVGDVDMRKDLSSSILLTGGSSLITGLEQRLSIEVPRLVSNAFKTKVSASKHSVERSCASWIGGSILTSLGSFQQLWLSRAEYEEYGATLAIQRFPV